MTYFSLLDFVQNMDNINAVVRFLWYKTANPLPYGIIHCPKKHHVMKVEQGSSWVEVLKGMWQHTIVVTRKRNNKACDPTLYLNG